MIKYVGFDKDGTLLDDMPGYAKVWGDIFQRDYGIDKIESSNFLLETSGQESLLQVKELLKRHNIILTEEELLNKSVNIDEELARQNISLPFPDVKNCLVELKKQDYKIFVSSNQQEDVVKRDLEQNNLLEYVDFYAGVKKEDTTFKKGKPHFEAAAKFFQINFQDFIKQTVFIGDTPTDLEVAKSVNIPCILRKSSNVNDSQINNGARFVVENFNDLSSLLIRI